MPLLFKRRQVAAVRETVGGTLTSEASLVLSTNADFTVLDSSSSADVEQVDRDLKRESLTLVKTTPGQKAGEITMTTELAGSKLGTHAAGAPPWALLLEGCGMEQVEISVITIGAVSTGPFQHGETISQAVSGATARVISSCHDGTTTLYVDKDSITNTINNTGVWTGGSSAATATPSTTESDEGFAWAPISVPLKKIVAAAITTATLAKGSLIEDTNGVRFVLAADVVVGATETMYVWPVRGGAVAAGACTILFDASGGGGACTINASPTETYDEWPSLSMRHYLDGTALTIAGARGSFVLSGEVNRPWNLAFTFRGLLSATTDVALISGVSADAPAQPPLWNGSAVGYVENETAGNDAVADELTPCLTSASFDIGVSLADRKCVESTGGLKEVIGAARDASGSIDPEVTLEADIPWLARLQDGATTRLRVPIGSSDGNKFTVIVEGAQVDSASASDRDGIAAYDIGLKLTGGYHHNLTGAGTLLDSYGGDNELVLIYHTS